MDFDKIFGWLKNSLFGQISSFFQSLFSPVETVASMLKEYGGETGAKVAEGVSSLKGQAANLEESIKSAINPESTTAQKETQAAVSNQAMYEPIISGLGLPTDLAQKLTAKVTSANQTFFANGVPGLDGNGTPASAVQAAKALHEEIIHLLIGDAQTTGVLANLKSAQKKPINVEQLNATAASIATAITGVKSDDDINLAFNLPTSGIVSMWGNLLKKFNTPNFDKNSLTTADFAVTFNKKTVDDAVASFGAAAPQIPADAVPKNVSGGTDVTQHSAPPAGGKKPKATFSLTAP